MEVSRKKWKFFILIFIVIFVGCSRDIIELQGTENDERAESVFPHITVELKSEFNRDDGSNYNLDDSINPENLEAFYDFDSDSMLTNDAADIYLFVSCGSDCFNIPRIINGASVVWLGETEANYDQCLEAFSIERAIQTLDAVPSHYSCLRTNSGQFVLIQVIDSSGDINQGTLLLKYVKFP